MNERRPLEAASISQAVGRLNLFDCSGLVVANRGLTERRGKYFHECDQMMERVVVIVPEGVPGLCEQAHPFDTLVPTSCRCSDAFWMPHSHTGSEPWSRQLLLASSHAIVASSAVANCFSVSSLANQSRGWVDLLEYLRESVSSFDGSMGDVLFREESNCKFAAFRCGAAEPDLIVQEQRLCNETARYIRYNEDVSILSLRGTSKRTRTRFGSPKVLNCSRIHPAYTESILAVSFWAASSNSSFVAFKASITSVPVRSGFKCRLAKSTEASGLVGRIGLMRS